MWEGRAVFLHWGVEVEFAAFPELEDGGGGEGFGDGGQAEEGGGGGRDGVFEVGHAEAGGPEGLAVENQCDGDTRDAGGGHEVGGGLGNQRTFLRGECGLLGGGGDGHGEEEKNREKTGGQSCQDANCGAWLSNEVEIA